jgi:hypothetical protein
MMSMSYAAEIIAGLRDLCKERQAINGSTYLTDSEYASIEEALQELKYEYGYGGATEWKNSLKRCLFG